MRWLILSFTVIVLDQLTKYWVIASLIPYQPQAVWPFFNLTLMFNKGSAFGFLSHWDNAASWFFSIIALVVSAIIITWLWKLPAAKRWQACTLALVLGGALSNVIDRIFRGHVIDFLDFYYKNWHFAAFNVADAAISVGAAMWFIQIFFRKDT